MEKLKTVDNGYKNYNSYGAYLKKKYEGQRVFKIIVDGGFTCPNRDGSKGYGGCTYCNVDSFTPELTRQTSNIREQIENGIERAVNGYKADKFIIYFQPNTNTYAPTHYLKMMYDEALDACPSDKVVGLSIGTRPDCIDAEKIALLESYAHKGLDVDLEMGMESIYNETLSRINRGCTHEELEHTLNLLENSTLDVCLHTVFGFPWESTEMMLRYAAEINRFPQIKFVKLHQLYVVQGSIMGVQYKREPFKLFSMEEYAAFLAQFIPLLRPDIVIQRLFGISDLDLLIAPNWGLKKSGIQTYLDKYLEKQNVVQGSSYISL
ncbi:TIGR01212 family radical SAM protein [Arcticibacter eurypsychrophilus]|uniref:TIGR01212 family radical SAM protein n=1 Tax=Arcticibacter eurypsychrophilus TaxID=1434752 RepID=UPI00147EAAF7|nr:TIGR01212 family radical SAM protein [Arcticibacter eurypsychrophilus]